MHSFNGAPSLVVRRRNLHTDKNCNKEKPRFIGGTYVR